MFTASGVPADGYALTGVIESSPATVLVAGKGNAMKNISQLEIPEAELNVSGYSGNMTTAIELKKYLPDTIQLAEADFSGKANVTVHIEREITSALTIEKDKVAITGIPAGMTAEIAEPDGGIRVNAVGLAQNLQNMDQTAVTASVNIIDYMNRYSLTELPAGVYEMNLVLTLPDGIRQKEEVPVQITISDAEEALNNEE